jgi:hypothetical protein
MGHHLQVCIARRRFMVILTMCIFDSPITELFLIDNTIPNDIFYTIDELIEQSIKNKFYRFFLAGKERCMPTYVLQIYHL